MSPRACRRVAIRTTATVVEAFQRAPGRVVVAVRMRASLLNMSGSDETRFMGTISRGAP